MKQKNKYIAYLLIAVSIIMLAASVFPHHHHWQELCLLQCDGEVCEDVCHDLPNHHEHHHNSNDCRYDCVTQFHCQQPQGSMNILPYGLPMAFLYFFFNFTPPENTILTTVRAYRECLHSVLWVIHCVGLRAPPSFL